MLKPYYQDDAVTLYHGNNIEILPQLGRFDMVLTSPPYDNLRSYNSDFDFSSLSGLLVSGLNQGGVIAWNVADETINGSETGTSMKQALGFMALGLNLHDTMIYHKTNGGANGSKYCYLACWEYVFILSKGRPKSINLIRDRKNATPPRECMEAPGRRFKTGGVKPRRVVKREEYGVRFNLWSYPVGQNETGHPAVMPFGLAKDHIQSWTSDNDIVVDPFAGSGTTGVAARRIRSIGVKFFKNKLTNQKQQRNGLVSKERKGFVE